MDEDNSNRITRDIAIFFNNDLIAYTQSQRVIMEGNRQDLINFIRGKIDNADDKVLDNRVGADVSNHRSEINYEEIADKILSR